MKHNEIKEIRGENGERMALAEDLNDHIAKRGKFPAFVMTYWLRTQPDTIIKQLADQALRLIMKTDVQDDQHLHEFHALVAIAVQAEMRNPDLQVNLTMYPVYVQNLLACLAVEWCRRKQWLKVETPPGVFKNATVELELTDKGAQDYVEGQERLADLVMKHLLANTK